MTTGNFYDFGTIFPLSTADRYVYERVDADEFGAGPCLSIRLENRLRRSRQYLKQQAEKHADPGSHSGMRLASV